MNSKRQQLLQELTESNLQHLYSSLIENGITEIELLQLLTLNDLQNFGVSSFRDKNNLMALINRLNSPNLKSNKIYEITKTPQKHSLSAYGTPIKSTVTPRRLPDLSNLGTPQTYSPSMFRQRAVTPLGSASRNLSKIMADESSAMNSPRSKNSSDYNLSALIDKKKSIGDRIKVCVRKRPLNAKELSRMEKDVVVVENNRMIVKEQKLNLDSSKYIENHSFIFDAAFDETDSNRVVYQETAAELVKAMFCGCRTTCFAYGQTGSGKTHTILNREDGLFTLALKDIFELKQNGKFDSYYLSVGFFEIYRGQLYDLLNGRAKIFAREDHNKKVCIQGLKEQLVQNSDQVGRILDIGLASRSVGVTGANSNSSRSHAILQISLKSAELNEVYGMFTFIDLAGSEKGSDRKEVSKETKLEGAEINKSLLALKECIRALDLDSAHLPFRQSKLTQVLKDSFVGNSKTCMIATVSPTVLNCQHTLNTLRYADRVKELKGDSKLQWEVEEDERPFEEEDFDDEVFLNRVSSKDLMFKKDNARAILRSLDKFVNNCEDLEFFGLFEDKLSQLYDITIGLD